jgi:hypothetical protein
LQSISARVLLIASHPKNSEVFVGAIYRIYLCGDIWAGCLEQPFEKSEKMMKCIVVYLTIALCLENFLVATNDRNSSQYASAFVVKVAPWQKKGDCEARPQLCSSVYVSSNSLPPNMAPLDPLTWRTTGWCPSSGNPCPDAELTKALVAKAAEKGLILLSCGVRGNVIRILTPLTIPADVLAEGLGIFSQVMRDCVKPSPTPQTPDQIPPFPVDAHHLPGAAIPAPIRYANR